MNIEGLDANSSLVWLIAAFLLLSVSVRQLQVYITSKNPVALSFLLAIGPSGLGVLMWGIAPYLSDSLEDLRPYYLIGDTLVTLGIATQAYFVWQLWMSERVRFLWIALGMIPLAAYAVYDIYQHIYDGVFDVSDGQLVVPEASAFLGIFSIFLVAVSVSFIMRAVRATQLATRSRQLAIGVLYLVVGLSNIWDTIISGNSETDDASSALRILFAVIFFVVIFFILTNGGSHGSKQDQT